MEFTRYTLKLLLLCLIFVGLVGCEPDIEIEKEDAIIEHSYKIITSEEIPDFDKIKTNLGNLENTSSIFLGRTVETYYGIENVITDEVIQITDEYGVSNYILEIDTHFEETGYLENMILMETTDGYISYIMRYTPSDEYMADELNYTPEGDFVIDPENFEGTITKYSLEREEIWNFVNQTQSSGGTTTFTVCTFSVAQYCSNVYSGNPNGDPHIKGPRCEGPFSYQVEETCVQVTVGMGSNPPSDAGGSEGNNNNGQTDGTLIIDGQPLSGIGTSAVSNELTAIKQFSENIDIRISVLIALLEMNINHPLYNYINFEMEGETMQQVINFLTDNKDENGDVLPESKAFALEAIQFIMENPEISFSEYENLMQDFIIISQEIPSARLDRFIELNDKIEANPWVLIQDCAQQNGMNTQDYLQLYNHDLPQSCENRLDQLGSDFNLQPLDEGNAACANIDYYGIEITTKPDFDNDGQPDTQAEVFEKFREKFLDLASGEKNDFQFSCNEPGIPSSADIYWDFIPYDSYDTNLWNSTQDPTTSILGINAGSTNPIVDFTSDLGAIMISDYSSNHWIGSTITTYESGSQPFSGNREWGILINQNGNFEIYTRAVDVVKISNLIKFGPGSDECKEDTYYNIAEETWENLQEEIEEWIENEGGGQANILIPDAIRVDKEKIKELLESNESIDEIGCD